MFKILGSDQKEYGPVSAEEIRRWALDGRVDLETKAQRIGEEEWKPLSAHPEFLDLSSAGVSKGQPPPFLSAIDADAFAKTVLERSIGVGVGSCISRSWHLYKNNFGKVFLATLLVTLAASVGLFVPYCGSFIYMSLQGVFYGGLYGFFLKLLRSQEAEIDDAFAGFKSFIPLMLGGAIPSLLSGLAALPFLVFSLVWFVATLSKGETGSQFSPIAVLPAVAGLGLALLIVLFLHVLWCFTLPLVIDKRLPFWKAMELSRKVVSRALLSVFLLVVVSWLIGFSGVLLCCVGATLTGPISVGAMAYAYDDLFGSASRVIETMAP